MLRELCTCLSRRKLRSGTPPLHIPKVLLPWITFTPGVTSRNPEGNPPTMSTPWNLHRLYSLDPSSPDFLRRLYSLMRYDEEDLYLSSIQGSKLAQLLEFLDQVRTLSLASVESQTSRSVDPQYHF